MISIGLNKEEWERANKHFSPDDFMPLIPKKLFIEFIEAAFLEGRMEDTSLEDYILEFKKEYNI